MTWNENHVEMVCQPCAHNGHLTGAQALAPMIRPDVYGEHLHFVPVCNSHIDIWFESPSVMAGSEPFFPLIALEEGRVPNAAQLIDHTN